MNTSVLRVSLLGVRKRDEAAGRSGASTDVVMDPRILSVFNVSSMLVTFIMNKINISAVTHET